MPCRTTKASAAVTHGTLDRLLAERDGNAQAALLQATSNTTVRLKIAFQDMGGRKAGTSASSFGT